MCKYNMLYFFLFCTTSKHFKNHFPVLIWFLTLILNFNIYRIEISTPSLWFLNPDTALQM